MGIPLKSGIRNGKLRKDHSHYYFLSDKSRLKNLNKNGCAPCKNRIITYQDERFNSTSILMMVYMHHQILCKKKKESSINQEVSEIQRMAKGIIFCCVCLKFRSTFKHLLSIILHNNSWRWWWLQLVNRDDPSAAESDTLHGGNERW